MLSCEEQAKAIGNDPKLLLKRFKESAFVCNGFLKKGATMNFDEKTYTSGDGKVVLEWSLRPFPDQPESYENQQTNRGTVGIRMRNG